MHAWGPKASPFQLELFQEMDACLLHKDVVMTSQLSPWKHEYQCFGFSTLVSYIKNVTLCLNVYIYIYSSVSLVLMKTRAAGVLIHVSSIHVISRSYILINDISCCRRLDLKSNVCMSLNENNIEFPFVSKMLVRGWLSQSLHVDWWVVKMAAIETDWSR